MMKDPGVVFVLAWIIYAAGIATGIVYVRVKEMQKDVQSSE